MNLISTCCHLTNLGALRAKTLRTRSLLGVALLAVGLAGGQAAHAGQILSNPGFEAGFNNWAIYSSQTWNYAITTANVHSGANALKLFGQYNGAPNWTVVQERSVCAPGCTYAAEGWAFTLSSDELAG